MRASGRNDVTFVGAFSIVVDPGRQMYPCLSGLASPSRSVTGRTLGSGIDDTGTYAVGALDVEPGHDDHSLIAHCHHPDESTAGVVEELTMRRRGAWRSLDHSSVDVAWVRVEC